jgi:hypothetical protein
MSSSKNKTADEFNGVNVELLNGLNLFVQLVQAAGSAGAMR